MGLTVDNRWIGVDLDGTLAGYDGWVSESHIGPLIPAMVEKVKRATAMGIKVKIFTSRANNSPYLPALRIEIAKKLAAVGIPELEIVCSKDFGMIELWDDRAVGVQPNTGEFLSPSRYLL